MAGGDGSPNGRGLLERGWDEVCVDCASSVRWRVGLKHMAKGGNVLGRDENEDVVALRLRVGHVGWWY